MKKLCLLTIMAVCLFTACGQNEDIIVDVKTTYTTKATLAATSYLGKTVFDLLAGQHILIGNVIVANDSENLYVTFLTEGDWYMSDIYLYVGSTEDGIPMNGNNLLPPGKFPYKITHSPYVQEHTYMIPLEGLSKELYVATHATALRIVDGKVKQKEAACGEGEAPGKNWFMIARYTVEEYSEEPEPVQYQEETAWGWGIKYGGNWAMYTPYQAEEQVELIAGNPKNNKTVAGYITFSKVEERKVTITIELIEGWELQPVAESVKIQGYEKAPSGNPAPGLFESYKGADLVITADAAEFYGIHLDVRKEK